VPERDDFAARLELAQEEHLVDELGGYSVALRLAKEAANLPPEAPFTLTVFPREETLPELLYNRLSGADREREVRCA